MATTFISAGSRVIVEEVHRVNGEDMLAAIEELQQSGYTGAVAIHFSQGRAQQVEWRKKLPTQK